jgi:tRNA pseudouridine55 synthase
MLTGVLLLDKPHGISSNAALQRAKRLFQAAKAGHTGTLDPLATGLLPICFGEATKFASFLLDAAKAYRAVIRLGITTTTGDAEGEVTSTHRVATSVEQVEACLRPLTGKIDQLPPLYSALKYQGRPYYEYARAGIDVPRIARPVTVYTLSLDSFQADEVTITLACSKGTYVRTIATELGAALGCGAHLTQLRRLASGPFRIDDASTLDQLQDMPQPSREARLLPVDVLIASLPQLTLNRDEALRLQHGLGVTRAEVAPGAEALALHCDGSFVGVGRVDGDGTLRPRRLLATQPRASDTVPAP